MKHIKYLPAFVVMLMMAIATPASAQLFDFPVYLLPVQYDGAEEDGNSWAAGTFATGVNDASGKSNAIGAAFGTRMPSVSFSGGAGYILSGVDELTFGGNVAAPLKTTEDSAISLQLGVGYLGVGSGSQYSIPFAAGFQKTVVSSEAAITYWGAPRIQWSVSRFAGMTSTSTNFGASFGASFNLSSGVGFHSALDYLNTSGGDPLIFGAGIHKSF